MGGYLILAVMCSVLSATLTWLLAWWLFQRRVKPAIEAELLGIQEQFEKRVHTGVLAAGQELLPEFRKQVSLGFRDALDSTATVGLVEDSAKLLSRSADVFEDGLKTLFGVKPGRRPPG